MKQFFKSLKKYVWLVVIILTLIIIVFGQWLYKLDQSIQQRLESRTFAPPIEFYTAAPQFAQGNSISVQSFFKSLQQQRMRMRTQDQPLYPGDYSLWEKEKCQKTLWPDLSTQSEMLQEYSEPNTLLTELNNCIALFLDKSIDPLAQQTVVALNEHSQILGIFAGPQHTLLEKFSTFPDLFAQYYDGQPILRHEVELSSIPSMCLNAVVSIEDSEFLEHSGVSYTGIFRALVKNLSKLRLSQGGSTITQQTVKNYFLTSERTLKRKFIEFFMAQLLEHRASKDQILEIYTNLIYMGQSGPFQVRGFAAASEHYFQKNIQDLNLSECALLAAIVNSPGLFNPFKNPDKAQQRRKLVLERMTELGYVNAEQAASAQLAPLPTERNNKAWQTAPFFIEAALKQLREAGLALDLGLKVYTTLQLPAQTAAQEAVRTGLEQIEQTHKLPIQNAQKGKRLEGILVSADVQSGAVRAIVGGRDFRMSQFNRALDGHRQVGSVMKPFVYLTALHQNSPDGTPYSPTTLISDESFTHKYDGQSWKPENYDKQFHGQIPMYVALKNSYNVATARLGLDIGLGNIIDLAKKAGIHSSINRVPALTLGAFEIYPLELLQAYASFASLGEKIPLTFVTKAISADGEILFEQTTDNKERVFDEAATAELVSMLQQGIETGTGKRVRQVGFRLPAAGKTGTTSDSRDAWFAGFTPDHVAVVWLGYDDNSPHGLTGGASAAPIWAKYMKSIEANLNALNFSWPNNTVVREIDETVSVPHEDSEQMEDSISSNNKIPLVFKSKEEAD